MNLSLSSLVPQCRPRWWLLGFGIGLVGASSAWAEWRTLGNPVVTSEGGTVLVIESDGSFFADYQKPEPSVQTVEFEWSGGILEGFKLSALTDERLPQTGPGWAPHGNFILPYLSLTIVPPEGPAQEIPIEHAYTDHEQDGWTLSATLSLETADTGWAIAGTLGQDHEAYFAPESPIEIPAGSRLRFVLHQGTAQFSNHQMGRFRIETTTDPADVARYFSTRLRLTVLDDSPQDPFELCVAEDGRIFYIERLGAIKRSLPESRSSVTVGQLEVFSQLDDGLIGLTLDPDFVTNGWIYLCYSAPDVSENRVSRFALKNDRLDLASEKILIRIPVQRDTPPCHTGGSMAFDPSGNLLISTGDNINPFDSAGYSPTDERPGRAAWDAQSTAGNTLDLRGKILRITPQPDGSYIIPPGNLFASDNPLARPEIYVMGCRNPFRLTVDEQSGTVYWGDVGPDAHTMDPERGPPGYDEINQAQGPGNYGWPFFIANNQAYRKFDFEQAVAVGTWSAQALKNTSPHNDGLQELPRPQPALISYTYSHSPDTKLLGVGGRCTMAGPVYHFDPDLESDLKLPAEFDRHLFFYDWMRGRIIAAELDENEQPKSFRRILAGVPIRRPMDMELGPDGALYLIEWGTKYNGGNSDASIARIEAIPPGESDDARWNPTSTDEPQFDQQSYLSALGTGDATSGETLLRNAHHLSCLNCHRLGDHGGVAGPSFAGIGSRLSGEQILEAILHPSRTISPGYGLITVKLTDDSTVAGFLTAETKQTLMIATPDQGEVQVTKSELAHRSALTSTMPAFNGVLTPAEAADLVAFLEQMVGSIP